MPFTLDELKGMVGRIVVVTLVPKGETQQSIKGRVAKAAGTILSLRGDAEAADNWTPHDDVAPRPEGRPIRRLKSGEVVDLQLDDLDGIVSAGET
jgi:hypothetical protein